MSLVLPPEFNNAATLGNAVEIYGVSHNGRYWTIHLPSGPDNSQFDDEGRLWIASLPNPREKRRRPVIPTNFKLEARYDTT